jgi:hypothetical protein
VMSCLFALDLISPGIMRQREELQRYMKMNELDEVAGDEGVHEGFTHRDACADHSSCAFSGQGTHRIMASRSPCTLCRPSDRECDRFRVVISASDSAKSDDMFIFPFRKSPLGVIVGFTGARRRQMTTASPPPFLNRSRQFSLLGVAAD